MKPSKRKINVIDLSLLEHLGKEIRDKVMTLNFKEIEGQRISIPHKSNYQIIRRNEKICEQSKELSYTELAQIHDRSIRQIRRITAPGSEYWRGMKSWDPSGLLQDAMSNATIPDKISATSVTPLTPVIPTAKRIERSKYIKAKDAERIYGIKAANFYLWARTKKIPAFGSEKQSCSIVMN